MKAGSVCVVGSFMMDLALRAPRRPNPGETVIGTRFEMFLGGKGFNQAVAAARAGSRTSMIGCLGADEFGRQFRAQLDIEGIDSSHVMTDDEGTGIGMPLIEASGENSIVVVPRANARLTPAHVERASSLIAAADVLLLQLELSMDVVIAAARLAKAAGVLVVMNPAPAPPAGSIERLRGLIDVLVPNESEARALGAGLSFDGDPRAAREISEWLQTPVVMTVGAQGCLVADGDEAFELKGHDVAVIDTVGAGDAFCGALGSWMAAGASLREAVVHANAAGALAVTRSGAEPAMPKFDSIIELVASASNRA